MTSRLPQPTTPPRSEAHDHRPAAPGWRELGAALWAMLRQRCPRCRTGRMFRGLCTMNDPCPVCGLIFQREEGYFFGALYFSYALSLIFLITFYVLAAVLLPGWNGMLIPLVATLPYLPLMPVVYRYSRVFWIYFDRSIRPGDEPAGLYEKVRRRRAEQTAGRNGHRPVGPAV